MISATAAPTPPYSLNLRSSVKSTPIDLPLRFFISFPGLKLLEGHDLGLYGRLTLQRRHHLGVLEIYKLADEIDRLCPSAGLVRLHLLVFVRPHCPEPGSRDCWGCAERCMVDVQLQYCIVLFGEGLVTEGGGNGVPTYLSLLKFIILYENLNFSPFVRMVLATMSLLKSTQIQNRRR